MKKTTCALLALAISAFSAGISSAEEKAKEITISGLDNMQYDVKTFEVEAEKKVKLIFKNIGKLPKIVMGHNLVILNQGNDPMAFAAAGISAGVAKEYIADAQKDKILKDGDKLLKTPILGPGEEATLEFKAPKATGDYPYVCTFPGHSALMKGIMKVK